MPAAALKVVVALLSTLAVVNIIFILSLVKELNKLLPSDPQYTYIGDDFPAQLPIALPPVALLHCLDVLRVAFASNRTGTSDPHTRAHVTHCLRYLRQAVLCHADATLEPDEPGVRDGRWEHAASGVGAVHRCRDWTVLRRYLDAHPAEPLDFVGEEEGEGED
ncbi:hypothetical protein C8Q78DRAFT_1065231 [Trametes maxima]|nr:hypothetical protein C8Q78DRAFT_1065231 [Trametes maxima]